MMMLIDAVHFDDLVLEKDVVYISIKLKYFVILLCEACR